MVELCGAHRIPVGTAYLAEHARRGENMSTTEPALRARNLRTLALLASLFVVPLALAFVTYYGTTWRPLARVNHGELIIPARALPASTLAQVLPAAPAAPATLFRDKWTLV